MNPARADGQDLRRRRCRYGAAGLVLLVLGLTPWTRPGGSLLVETLQFALVAFGVAPLCVCALPPELTVRTGADGAPRRRRTRVHVAAPVALFSFVLVTAGWRTPAAVNALATYPLLVLVEICTLVAGTAALWMAVIGTPAWFAPKARVLRIALAGGAAWSVWIFAYVVGFTGHAFYRSYRSGASPLTVQELSVAALWLTSTAALAPTIFRNLSRWLTSEQVLAESESIVRRSAYRLGLGPEGARGFDPGDDRGH